MAQVHTHEQAKDIPAMAEVLKNTPSNWGRWGPDDEVGALNFLTADEVLRGVQHIRTGEVYTLQRLIGDPRGDPVWPGRTSAKRTMVIDESTWDTNEAPKFPGGLHYADDKLDAYLQGSTQYDALGHVWYDGKIWNGYDARTTIGGMDKASVAPLGERGIVGRGVLLDMARHRGKNSLDKGETFNHEDLEACASAQGISIEPHDIVIVRTNFMAQFFEDKERFYQDFCEPGLTFSPELVRWFHEREIPNLVTDTIANEVTYDPVSGVALPLHCALMRNLGVTLTEICDLEKLAASCAIDGRYSFFYVAAPLKVYRGTGSPVNPVVIK